MSDTCHPAYGISSYPACSGNGHCISGLCVCKPGWMSVSDFELDPGYDCDINKNFVIAWSSFNFALTTIGCVVILYCLYRDKLYTVQKRFKLKTICNYCFFLTNVGGMMYTGGKLVNAEHYIVGHSWLTTLGGFTLVFGGMYGLSVFFLIIIRFLQSYARLLDSTTKIRIKSYVRPFVKLAPIVPIVIACFFTVINIILHKLPNKYSDQINMAGCITFTIGYIYYAMKVIYVFQVFLKEMKSFIDNAATVSMTDPQSSKQNTHTATSSVGEIKHIYEKIVLVDRLLTPFLLNGAPLNILFCTWLFMRRKVLFLLMFQLSLIAPASIALAWSLSSVKGYQPTKQTNLNTSVIARLSKMSNRDQTSLNGLRSPASATGRAFIFSRVRKIGVTNKVVVGHMQRLDEASACSQSAV